MIQTQKKSTHQTLSQSAVPLKWFDEYLAGVNYDKRFLVVSKLALREHLVLKPQRNNPQDANAITVETLEGRQVGYLRRELAAALRKFLERSSQPVQGVITELSCDADGSSYRVRIIFSLPSNWFDSAGANPGRQIEYFYDDSGLKTYMLLDCSEDLFAQVREKLTADQIPLSRYGLCYRPAKNGRQYQWYICFERTSELSRLNIEKFFRRRFKTEPDPLEQERHRLESEIIELQAELSKACKERDDYESLAVVIDSESHLVKQRLGETIDQLQGALTARELEVHRLEEETRRLTKVKFGPNGTSVHPSDTLYDVPEYVTDVFTNYAGEHLTPYETLEVINKLYPNRIEILPSAWNAAKDSSSFKRRRELLGLLLKLVTEYWGALASGRSDVDARLVFGDCYAATESERVEKNKRHRRKRTFEYKGEAVEMMKHLKIGTKESVAETLRIHFHWDVRERKIVIGHCGPHL